MREFSASPVRLQATSTHCIAAFDALTAHYNNPGSRQNFAATLGIDNAECPLFVTWNTASESGSPRSHWRLRGCIGTLEPRDLHSALHDYALTSALRDHRFSPIRPSELPHLRCTVSLLSCFAAIASWRAWEVGVHGLIIEFDDPDGGQQRSATFLPDVAREQGWSKQECVDALIRKAGFSGRVTSALRESLQIVTYQSTTASLTYNEYTALKAEMEEGVSDGGEGVAAEAGLQPAITVMA
ncbi:MAG: hypothetical protein WDW36_004988 [Sanguina aurantia]